MAKRKKRGFTTFILFTIAAVLTFSLLTREGKKTLDYWQDRLRSHQNWVYYKLGLPLPGTPDLARLKKRLQEKGLKRGNPIFIRIFKLENELELWMRGDDGFKLFATYPICRWSGGLGPKLKEGDRQSPEGFYTVAQRQLNANSRWYKSFNLGYPNAYDKSYKRTGSYLMVHGGCSSIGCYAITNPVMKEVWQLVFASYQKGHKRFAVHAFPFRMTARNRHVYKNPKWQDLWDALAKGYDLYNETRVPPKITVCNKRYHVEPGKDEDKSYQQPISEDCSNIEVSQTTTD